MDDNSKQVSSYQLDQEILDARGIDMTVEEVAGLPTCKYAERVQSLLVTDDDLAFLKGLRRRIKNRLASQNSRRRSMEHLRRLTRELRAVRACRDDALSERRTLVQRRDSVRDRCVKLRQYVAQILQERSDPTEVPAVEPNRISESQKPTDQPKEITIKKEKKVIVTETKTPLLSECFQDQKIERDKDIIDQKLERDKSIFECRIDKLVQQSVNHIFKEKAPDKKKIFAKTVFISNEKYHSNVKSMVMNGSDLDKELKSVMEMEDDCGVLNLSVKERRKTHGRKQPAPRRIVYACVGNDDGVLDLKVNRDQ